MTIRSVHQEGSTPLRDRPSKATDPWMMPLDDPAHAAAVGPSLAQLDEDLPMPEPLDRTGEDEDTLRARLVYQTRKRGTLETDLILGTYAKENLGKMSVVELKQFDKLLDEPDWDIYYWSIGKRQPPPRWAGTELLEKLKVHAKNEGRQVRVMPELGRRGGL